MTDPKRTEGAGKVTSPKSPQKDPAQRQHTQRTAGTDRDFDESEESKNQGHGHPREERGRTTD
jgi:hypothetical protein